MKVNRVVRCLRLFVMLLMCQSSLVVAQAKSKLRKMKMKKKKLQQMGFKRITERLLFVGQLYSLTKEKQPFLIIKRNLGLIRQQIVYIERYCLCYYHFPSDNYSSPLVVIMILLRIQPQRDILTVSAIPIAVFSSATQRETLNLMGYCSIIFILEGKIRSQEHRQDLDWQQQYFCLCEENLLEFMEKLNYF